MKILVTGGTGYIGSHVVVELLNAGHEITIIDNLANSKITVLEKITKLTGKTPRFFQIDLLSTSAVSETINEISPELVIHFAGLKSVFESIENPLLYYKTNLESTFNLLNAMKSHHVNKIIFSSSATVYGDQPVPEHGLTETLETGRNLSNPYGRTKYMTEEILKDVVFSNPNFSAVALRYFNPVGNHPSGLLGEDPNDIPNNLMPYVMKVARGELEKLSIFGNDYDTPDGTCERDFIHVVDLAKGHLAAIPALETTGFKAYNLGTGHPTSVLEMMRAFETASGRPLPYQFSPRRPGDLPVVFANPSLASSELNWQSALTIETAMKDTLAFLNLA